MLNSCKNKAAVLIVQSSLEAVPRILLTRKTSHLNSHGGEVAFPGGKWEPEDASLQDTALRETQEEVGIHPDQINIIGQLPSDYTRRQVAVKPYVSELLEPVIIKPCDFEIESTFWVDIDWLKSDKRVRTDIFQISGKEYWAPVYEYRQYVIWGFTARVITVFLNQFHNGGIEREHEAPEVLYQA